MAGGNREGTTHGRRPFMTLTFADRLRALIAAGPVQLQTYMALAGSHYYATRDPLGAAGDFTTAPEISQMFGELIGLWLADIWQRAGSPAAFDLVELGPGRGTLMADALRATARVPGFHVAAHVHLVETSPVLRTEQAKRVPGATWHDSLDTLPNSCPLLLIANEFFDALPIRQLQKTANGWRERMVTLSGDKLALVLDPRSVDALVPGALRDAPEHSVHERCAMGQAAAQDIGARLAAQGGAALFIDYGYAGPQCGETLQALRAHRPADLLAEPGEADLTAHVDFTALAQAAHAGGARCFGPIPQGQFLQALGIDLRARQLAQSGDASAIIAARDRLVGDDQMGRLFKALALTAANWPQPAAFPTPEGA